MGQSVCRALTADFTATRNIQGAKGRAWVSEPVPFLSLSSQVPTGCRGEYPIK